MPEIFVPTHDVPESLKGRVRLKPCKVCGGTFVFAGATVAEDAHEFICLGCGRRHILVQPGPARKMGVLGDEKQ
jgi:hypothetical protein